MCCFFNGFVYNYAMASAIASFRYNIPVKALILANGDLDKAVMMLSLKELGEIRTV